MDKLAAADRVKDGADERTRDSVLKVNVLLCVVIGMFGMFVMIGTIGTERRMWVRWADEPRPHQELSITRTQGT